MNPRNPSNPKGLQNIWGHSKARLGIALHVLYMSVTIQSTYQSVSAPIGLRAWRRPATNDPPQMAYACMRRNVHHSVEKYGENVNNYMSCPAANPKLIARNLTPRKKQLKKNEKQTNKNTNV